MCKEQSHCCQPSNEDEDEMNIDSCYQTDPYCIIYRIQLFTYSAFQLKWFFVHPRDCLYPFKLRNYRKYLSTHIPIFLLTSCIVGCCLSLMDGFWWIRPRVQAWYFRLEKSQAWTLKRWTKALNSWRVWAVTSIKLITDWQHEMKERASERQSVGKIQPQPWVACIVASWINFLHVLSNNSWNWSKMFCSEFWVIQGQSCWSWG